jgi:hypothetical protein
VAVTSAQLAAWTVTRGAGSDFTFGGAGTAHAFDPATGAYNATPRNLTRALLVTNYAGGGFANGTGILDPVTGCSIQIQ